MYLCVAGPLLLWYYCNTLLLLLVASGLMLRRCWFASEGGAFISSWKCVVDFLDTIMQLSILQFDSGVYQ